MMEFIRKHDLGYKLLALLLSLGFWFYVMGVKDPEITLTVRDVPVNYTGESALAANNDLQIISGRITETDIKVTGARSQILPLKNTDISVVANVSEITEAGKYTIPCRIQLPSSTVKQSGLGVTLSLFVDRLDTVDVPVHTQITGKPAEGYSLGAPVVEPTTISVTGPSTELSKLSQALVNINAGTISDSFYGEYAYSFTEVDGGVCESDHLIRSVEKVTVSLPVLMKKTVPLSVSLHESGALTEYNADVHVTPAEITISGEKSMLQSISSISIGTINLEDIGQKGIDTSMEITMPEGIINVSGVNYAAVNATLKNISTKTFSVTNFKVINIPDGKYAEVLDGEKQVTVIGSTDVLNELRDKDFTLVADMSSVSSSNGKKTVIASVIYTDTTNKASTVGDITLQVRIGAK